MRTIKIGNVANLITATRIIFSFQLLLFDLHSCVFYILYLLCGLSDILDGFIARKTNNATEFGAKLDSIADLCFVIVYLIKFLPVIKIPLFIAIWIIAIAVAKILALLKTKDFSHFHSLYNKITGIMLFILPFTFTAIDTNCSVLAICVLASFATLNDFRLLYHGDSYK